MIIPNILFLINTNPFLKILQKKQSSEVKEAYNLAKNAVESNKLSEWIMPNLIALLTVHLDIACKPLEKEHTLYLLELITEKYPTQIQYSLIDLVPVVSNLFLGF